MPIAVNCPPVITCHMPEIAIASIGRNATPVPRRIDVELGDRLGVVAAAGERDDHAQRDRHDAAPLTSGQAGPA